MSRITGSLIGAFAALHYYSKTGYHISLLRWTAIRDLLLHTNRLVAKVGSKEPIAATPVKVNKAIRLLLDQNNITEAVALTLFWFTGQRPCDVLLLLRPNVTCLDQGGFKFVARFNEGKVVGRIEAYHIHFRIAHKDDDDEAGTAVLKLLKERANHSHLFEFTNGYQRTKFLSTIRSALREQDDRLELRSLRRGTLQMYNRAGVPEAALLTYSRHTTIAALRRYLGWEAIETPEHRQLMDAADILAGGPPAEQDPIDEDWIAVDKDGSVRISADRTPPHPKDAKRDTSNYELLAKPQTITPVDTAAFMALAETCSPAVRDFFNESLRFIQDPSVFDGVSMSLTDPACRLDRRFIDKSVAVSHSIPVGDHELHKIRGYVEVFGRNEHDRNPPRVRMITFPKGLNPHVKQYAWKHVISNSTRRSSRVSVLPQEGRDIGAICLDCCGWFQQIPVSEDLSWYFCYKVGKAWFRYTRIATGGTWSPNVATAHTLVLIDDSPHKVIKDTSIDNMRFVGTMEECAEAAFRAIKRCAAVNAELNDVDVFKATLEEVKKLWKKKGVDFFGEINDYPANTICCREKHVAKIDAYLEAASAKGAPYYVLFGLLAMCLYMSETLGVDLREWHDVRLWFSRRGRELAMDHSLWRRASKYRPPLGRLREWVGILRQNKPARVVRAPEIGAVPHFDACAKGFAAIIDLLDNSEPTLLTHKWTAEDRKRINVHRSSETEPEAAARISEYCETVLKVKGRLLLVSDHEQFVWAVQKGHSLSAKNNDRLRRLAPWTEMIYEPGRISVADPYSRFKRDKLTSADAAEVKRRSRVYASARSCGVTYGIVGDGRSCPARIFRESFAHNVALVDDDTEIVNYMEF